ncbi:hypothetical protein F511_23695 [Dorcoceras hygrometricum]|uniref:Uncharacterized protein n=1 Tax=Dorcoceras hygrometricum TaxID=472368 RepID=A0A2Z7BE66_9LAMI|nr:hypothetical protein F511_23695 [Dorcoceras hygrometricum]
MDLVVVPSISSAPCKSRALVSGKQLICTSNQRYSRRNDGFRVKASFFNSNPIQLPILKEALREPVAFVGGIFAGFLRLDLNEDPLKEWVSRTVEAAGLSVEAIERSDGVEADETVPQQIEIE